MPQYRSGTVTVETNSPVVAGSGTSWAANVERGDLFLLAGDAVSYTVDAVPSDAEIHLSAPFAGQSASGAGYAVSRDFTPNRNYPIAGPGDIEAIRVFGRAIAMIDADIPVGGQGARNLDDLLDVDAAGASTGWVLAKRADGLFGFAAPGSGTTVANAVGEGAPVLVDGAGQLRRLRGENITIDTNADHLMLRGPAPGEANAGANVGGVGSVGLYRGKNATTLEFLGLRAGANMSIVPSGTDLVFSSTGTGTGTLGFANDGTGTVKLFRQQSGSTVSLRTVSFDAARFTTTLSLDNLTYTVGLRMPGMAELADVDAAGAAAGQVLVRQADGRYRHAAQPAAGIASLAADPAPRLSADLDATGRRIVGLPGVLPGLLAAPQAKSYVLVLSTPAPIAVTSMRAATASGTCIVDLRAGGIVVGSDGTGGGMTLTANPDGAEVAAPDGTGELAGGTRLSIDVGLPSSNCADLAFAIYYRTT